MATKKNWIDKAIKKPGALREQLGVKKGEKIPKAKLDAAAKKPGKLGQRARFAETLYSFKKPGKSATKPAAKTPMKPVAKKKITTKVVAKKVMKK